MLLLSLVLLYLFVFWGATSNSAQGLHLALCLEVGPGSTEGPCDARDPAGVSHTQSMQLTLGYHSGSYDTYLSKLPVHVYRKK